MPLPSRQPPAASAPPAEVRTLRLDGATLAKFDATEHDLRRLLATVSEGVTLVRDPRTGALVVSNLPKTARLRLRPAPPFRDAAPVRAELGARLKLGLLPGTEYRVAGKIYSRDRTHRNRDALLALAREVAGARPIQFVLADACWEKDPLPTIELFAVLDEPRLEGDIVQEARIGPDRVWTDKHAIHVRMRSSPLPVIAAAAAENRNVYLSFGDTVLARQPAHSIHPDRGDQHPMPRPFTSADSWLAFLPSSFLCKVPMEDVLGLVRAAAVIESALARTGR